MGLRLDGVGVGLSSNSWRLGLDSIFSSASWESWRSDYSGTSLAGAVFVCQRSRCLVSWRCSTPRVGDVVYGILVVFLRASLSLVSPLPVISTIHLWACRHVHSWLLWFIVGYSGDNSGNPGIRGNEKNLTSQWSFSKVENGYQFVGILKSDRWNVPGLVGGRNRFCNTLTWVILFESCL